MLRMRSPTGLSPAGDTEPNFSGVAATKQCGERIARRPGARMPLVKGTPKRRITTPGIASQFNAR